MNIHKDPLYPVSLTIVSPTDGGIIRSNSDVLDVTINVYVEPLMNQVAEGLERKVILDGKQVASGIGSKFQLQTVDRGALSLVVTLDCRQKIRRSPCLTLTLLRRSSIRV